METKFLSSFDKNNKLKIWAISVIDQNEFATLIITHGYKDCKMVETNINITEGKNIGKKNETTYLEQAIKEAQSRIEKKLKEGYIEESNNTTIKETLLPMLAQEYKKHKSKIKFPCFVQPKLDGYRMIYNPVSDQMLTRSGKHFTILNDSDLHKELKLLNLKFPVDGELYAHQELTFEEYGVLRKKSLTEKDNEVLEKIEFNIYDVICDKEFEKRLDILQKLNPKFKVKIVPTYKCETEQDIEKYHEKFLKEGYEGTMIRNLHGKYQCKFRSYDLLKYKNFNDSEFEIVGFSKETDTTGNNQNLIVWTCKTEKGLEFDVQSKGTRLERQKLYNDAKMYIGKKLWVQYFGLTNQGVPRFPKTMREGKNAIRDEVI